MTERNLNAGLSIATVALAICLGGPGCRRGAGEGAQKPAAAEGVSVEGLRSAEEVGVRLICLHQVSRAALESDVKARRAWLKKHDLWRHVTPRERAFLENDSPDERSVRAFSWRCECVLVLAWAAGLSEKLPPPRGPCDPQDLAARLPGDAQSPWPFIRGLKLRPASEIREASEMIYDAHWATRDAALRNTKPPRGLNGDVAQEWHHAINWLERYGNDAWDDVATDT